ncbi:MAG: hypothetical protein ACREP9_14735, partial [Candidatus Dormibacteraceae bacterium]
GPGSNIAKEHGRRPGRNAQIVRPLTRVLLRSLVIHKAGRLRPQPKPKFPLGRWARVFEQVIGPLITKIT